MTAWSGSSGPDGWRRTAWEGVRLDLPPGWEPLALSPGHLVAGPGGACGLELKTSPGPASGVPGDRLLRRLAAAAGRGRLETRPLPECWGPPPGAFSGYGFSWGHRGKEGQGAVLTCRKCRRTHLIQFFSPPLSDTALLARCLARLEDHREDGWREARVFDLRAAIPPGFTTDACRFEPGRFELAFSGFAARFRLLRFGPADMLLKGRGLAAFLTGQGLVPKRSEPRDRGGFTEWSTPQDRPRRWPGPFGSANCRLRAAHVQDSNRILAMAAESRKGLPASLLESIWSRYGVVAQTAR